MQTWKLTIFRIFWMLSFFLVYTERMLVWRWYFVEVKVDQLPSSGKILRNFLRIRGEKKIFKLQNQQFQWDISSYNFLLTYTEEIRLGWWCPLEGWLMWYPQYNFQKFSMYRREGINFQIVKSIIFWIFLKNEFFSNPYRKGAGIKIVPFFKVDRWPTPSIILRDFICIGSEVAISKFLPHLLCIENFWKWYWQ